jgi:cell division protein FtsW
MKLTRRRRQGSAVHRHYPERTTQGGQMVLSPASAYTSPSSHAAVSQRRVGGTARHASTLVPMPALFWLPVALSVIGLVFLTSVSIGGILKLGTLPHSPIEPFRPVLQQVCWVLLGVGLMVGLSHIPVRFWQASAWFWMVALSLLLLAMWWLPGLGTTRNGAERWLEFPMPFLGRVGFQPSELFKLATLLFFAALYSKPMVDWRKGILVALWLLTLVAIERQPDFGTMALILLLGVGVAFCGCERLARIGLWAVSSLVICALLIGLPHLKSQIGSPSLSGGSHANGLSYRVKRIVAMLDPWAYEYDMGYQMVRAQIAVGSGGLFRLAIGEGREKRYLPTAESDYIFATIAEETGFVGCLVCIGLLGWLVATCLRLAHRAPSRFGRLFAGGLALWIGLQSLVNIGMATGLIPTVGLPLPFISAGGSALISLMAALGIAQAIARETR